MQPMYGPSAPAALPFCVERINVVVAPMISMSTVAAARTEFLGLLASYVNADMSHVPAYPTTPAITPTVTIPIWGSLGTVKTVGPFTQALVAETGGFPGFGGRVNMPVPTSGQWLDTKDTFEITLTSPRNAFCCYMNDVGDFGVSMTFEFYSGASLVKSIPYPRPARPPAPLDYTHELVHFEYLNGAILFDRIRVVITQPYDDPDFIGEDYVAFDELVVGLVPPCTPP